MKNGSIERREKTTFLPSPAEENIKILRAAEGLHVCDTHYHDELTLTIVEKGSNRFGRRNGEDHYRSGDVILLQPGEIHYGHPGDDSGFQYSSLFIPSPLLEYCSAGLTEKMGASFDSGSSLQPGFFGRLSRLILSFERGDEDSQELLADLSLVLPVKLKNHSTTGDLMVNRAVELIRSNCELTVEELAARLDLSTFHFIRTFKEKSGFSPHKYILFRKVKEARRLIGEGMSLKDAAAAADFTDQSHMSRTFKKFYTITPGQFKKGY